MNNRIRRIFASFLFIVVFSSKMVISVAPIFAILDAKFAASVILQLEHETKDNKDTTEKNTLKEKKDFDEHPYALFDYRPLLAKTMLSHIQQKEINVKVHHPTVPTPPPNA